MELSLLSLSIGLDQCMRYRLRSVPSLALDGHCIAIIRL